MVRLINITTNDDDDNEDNSATNLLRVHIAVSMTCRVSEKVSKREREREREIGFSLRSVNDLFHDLYQIPVVAGSSWCVKISSNRKYHLLNRQTSH